MIRTRISLLSGLALVLSGSPGLSETEAALCSEVLVVDYQIPQRPADIECALKSGLWILKGHGEGGGNVCETMPTNNVQTRINNKNILMQKINILPTMQAISYFENGVIKTQSPTLSEVGVFTAGDRHHYAGYLIRTKPINELESGVHRGSGMINGLSIAG